MKNFKVRELKWATYSDLDLSFYKEWNRRNRLPGGFWQRIWEYPFAMLRIPKDDPNLDVGGTYPFVLFKHFPNTVSLDVRDLNELDHPLHKGLWPEGKLVVGDAQKMPLAKDSFRYSFSISAIEEMPNPLAVLKEMLRVTSERVVVTMDVSNVLGVSRRKLEAVLDFLGVKLPSVPKDLLNSDNLRQKEFRQPVLPEYSHIKVLGVVIDKDEKVKDCGIMVPHAESLPFLKACIRSVRENKNALVNQHIYVLDDNSKDGSFEKAKRIWGKDKDVTLVQIKRSNPKIPDVGQVLDEGLKYVKEQYVAMIDADVFPMSRHWVTYPIYLVERFNCSSVGCDTGLSSAYLERLPGKWKNIVNYAAGFGLFPNDQFTCTNNFYRVSLTATAKIVSQLVGYRRDALTSPINRFFDQTVNRLAWRLNSLVGRNIFPALEEGFPHADNGVYANYFIDRNQMGSKFSLPIITAIGPTPSDGVFGQNVCNLIFHFALSSRVFSRSHREIGNVGRLYMKYGRRIMRKGFDQPLLRELWGLADAEKDKNFRLWSWHKDQYFLFQDSFGNYLQKIEGGK